MILSGWEIFIEAGIKVVVAFALLLVTTIFLVWIERKVVADMQNRIGPNRAGPWGVLQTLADGLKLFFKESITPRKVQWGLYIAAPIASLIPALLIFLVIPIGRPFTIGDRVIDLAGMDLNVGILYFLALSSVAVYAVVLAGWSSGSKYPLLGAVRASAQMISYEAAMGLALVPLLLFTSANCADLAGAAAQSCSPASLSTIVGLQEGSYGLLPAWNIVLVPSFLVFFIAGVAETNRAPFDLVEAESEIVGGYHTEYSGIRFALFFLAEYINIFNISALTVTLFLGGWNGPTFGLAAGIAWILPIFWFLLKTFVLIFVFIWLRATLPRMRYDQLMAFGWKRLIPLTLVWILLSTVAIGFRRFGAPWS